MSSYGRGTRKHLYAVAKKKPRVQEAIDNLENISEDAIASLPNLPGWVKKELKSLHKEKQKRADGYLTPEDIAAIMIAKSQ